MPHAAIQERIRVSASALKNFIPGDTTNARPHWRGASDIRNVNRCSSRHPVQAVRWLRATHHLSLSFSRKQDNNRNRYDYRIENEGAQIRLWVVGKKAAEKRG